MVRPPISAADPSEAVESSVILPSVRQYFDVIAHRDYGGNLLVPIFINLLRPDQPSGPPSEVFDATIRRLLDQEDRLLARGEMSYHAVVVGSARAGI